MNEQSGSLSEEIAAVIRLQDEYNKATPSQDLLEDLPSTALPAEYRSSLRIRMSRDSFYVAFSDKPEDLEPNEKGFLPNAHIRKFSAMAGPRSTGTSIKAWIDQVRESQGNKKNGEGDQ